MIHLSRNKPKRLSTSCFRECRRCAWPYDTFGGPQTRGDGQYLDWKRSIDD